MIRDERLIQAILERVNAMGPGTFEALRMVEEGFDQAKLMQHIDHLIATGYIDGRMRAPTQYGGRFQTAEVTGLTPQGRALLHRMTGG
jgi:hypothetical protein